MLTGAIFSQMQGKSSSSAGSIQQTRNAEVDRTATAAAPAAVESSAELPSSQLQQALKEVQSAIQPVAQDLLFSVDKDTGKTVVKIVDSATDKVIRQIPSEELIAISKALDKLQGLLVKQQA
jgi:flagellar protein FlaG